jgi:uncharacterized phage protein (TIGR02216 family)
VNGSARAFPWDDAIAFGLGVLRLAPRDFWAMSPRELECVLRSVGGQGAIAPDAAALAHLMARYPDGSEQD